METRAHYFIIGLFTVIIVSAALLFSLWLVKAGSDGKLNYYDVVFNEPINGLSQGSPVQFSGIKVGDVLSLKLDPSNPNKVWARIRVNASTPIRTTTQAKLLLTGITGTSVIQLSGQNEPSSPLLVSKNDTVPIIVATPSSLSQILTNSEDLMTNINQIAANLNKLTSAENVKRIGSILDNLDKISGSLADERENIELILQQASIASKQLNETLGQTTQAAKSANNLLNTEGKQLVSEATKTMTSLSQTTANINKMLDENKGAVNDGVQGLSELGPALTELQKTLSSLRNITNKLNQDPAGYILGKDKPKEFKP